MRLKSFKVFVRVLVFGLVLGAASSAYADTIAITSYTFGNLQFTAASGTAQFTLTGTTARAAATNTFGQNIDNLSNMFPVAQATATVDFASSVGTANANTNSVSGLASASISACSCTASSFSIATFTGTLIIVGAEGNVNVDISALTSHLRQLQTDQSGLLAQSEILFDLFVNGTPVFTFQVELFHPLSGPNRSVLLQSSDILRTGTITLPAGVEHTITARLTVGSFAQSEVPEPATVVLLVSGLGFMTGVLKKRRKARDE
jgi:hypothetical protein